MKKLFVNVKTLVDREHITGVQRVNRDLTQALMEISENHDIIPVTIEPDKIYEVKWNYPNEFKKGKVIDIDEINNNFLLALDIDNNLFFWLNALQINKMIFHNYDSIFIYFPQYFHFPLVISNCVYYKHILSLKSFIKFLCISKFSCSMLAHFNSKITKNPNLLLNYYYLGFEGTKLELHPVLEDYFSKKYKKALSGKVNFLMVGTLEPRKGHYDIIKTFEILWEKGYDVNLIIIGRKGWCIDWLEKYIKNHTQYKRKLFWFDSIDDYELAFFYKKADALIQASKVEGFGLPIIEASTYKIPIIARDIPVFREIGKNNILYFPNTKNYYEISKFFENIINNLEKYKNYYIPISKTKTFSWKNAAKRILDIIENEEWVHYSKFLNIKENIDFLESKQIFKPCEFFKKFLGDKKLALFGAGGFGKKIKYILNNLGIKVELFLDNDIKKHNTFIDGIPVIHPEKINMQKIKNNYKIIITSTWGDAIKEQLESYGFEELKDFIWHEIPNLEVNK